MSGEDISIQPIATMFTESLKSKLTDDRLNQICSVKAIKTIRSEDTLLLQDHSRSLRHFVKLFALARLLV